MGDVIQDQIHFLLLFVSDDTSRQQREALLDTITKVQLHALSEVSLNILKGSLGLSTAQKQALKRHASRLRLLSHKKSTLNERRECLTVSLVYAILAPLKSFFTHQLASRYGGH